MHVGIELRAGKDGGLEVVRERADSMLPSALVDVDGDGELEAIETEGWLALRSFDRSTTYQSLSVEHCF